MFATAAGVGDGVCGYYFGFHPKPFTIDFIEGFFPKKFEV
jgi:hypothetical protein